MMGFAPKKIDLYIFRRFMVTFALAMILIIGIVIIFDISEKIDDFVAKEAPLKAIIFDYYLNFIPYFINMFSPLFVFITVIFFTSRMAANSEIIAILCGGVSYSRMLVPYIVSATIICLLSLGLNLFVIPQSNKTRLGFEQKYVKSRNVNYEDVHYQIAPGEFVYVERFSTWNNTAYKFTLEKVDKGRLVSKTAAESAVWDSTYGGWHLRKYFTRTYAEGGLGDKIVSGAQKDTILPLTVTDFYRNKKTVETLDYKQLSQLIETQKMRGDHNVMYSEIEMHTRFAMPFSGFILTLMGVALSSRKKRGGIGWNIGIGIGLAFTYILFQRFSQMFVFTGAMSPVLAIWLPNLLYALVAGILYTKAQK